jgi:hypothetical protein
LLILERWLLHRRLLSPVSESQLVAGRKFINGSFETASRNFKGADHCSVIPKEIRLVQKQFEEVGFARTAPNNSQYVRLAPHGSQPL